MPDQPDQIIQGRWRAHCLTHDEKRAFPTPARRIVWVEQVHPDCTVAMWREREGS